MFQRNVLQIIRNTFYA